MLYFLLKVRLPNRSYGVILYNFSVDNAAVASEYCGNKYMYLYFSDIAFATKLLAQITV